MNDFDERALHTPHVTRSTASADTVSKVGDWNVWTCEVSEFTYNYQRRVSFLVREGTADLAFETGERVSIRPQDFITIEVGSVVSWRVTSAVRNSFCYHDTFPEGAS
jgi:uncharacterized cupin superfamily protein